MAGFMYKSLRNYAQNIVYFPHRVRTLRTLYFYANLVYADYATVTGSRRGKNVDENKTRIDVLSPQLGRA